MSAALKVRGGAQLLRRAVLESRSTARGISTLLMRSQRPQNAIMRHQGIIVNNHLLFSTVRSYSTFNEDKNEPQYDSNGNRIYSEKEAKEIVNELKKIWSDQSISERESIKNLFDKYEMGGMISPSATKVIAAILKDEESAKPGEKIENVHRFHESLLQYHNRKQFEHNQMNHEDYEPKEEQEDKKNVDMKFKIEKNSTKNNKAFNFKSNQGKNGEKFLEMELRLDVIFGVLFGLVTLFLVYSATSRLQQEITFQEFENNYLAKGFVDKLVVVNNEIVEVVLNDSGRSHANHPTHDVFYFTIGSLEVFEEKLKQAQINHQIPEQNRVPVIYIKSTNIGKALWSVLPTVLLFAFIFWSSSKLLSSSGGMGGGLFGAPKKQFKKFNADSNVKIRFSDVAGCDEAKEEIMEFVNFLKHPEKYEKLGAKIPRGAILNGPPGTGKTLMAKATAGEAGVPFYSVSGSEFVEMFVGVGASRVRELFKTARENAPSIVFVDEIDAIGKSRGKGKGMGGNDERENTLNQLLVEMDGFASSDHVVVFAGTNRMDVLDSALLRPGRFDRKIYIGNPELDGRKDIFGVHLKQIKLNKETTDLDDLKGRLAALTPGFSGADIANVCNEAALIAARGDQDFVTLKNFEQAIERVIGGLEKKNKLLSANEKKIVAYHEAGHAICGWYLEFADPLLKVSIVPRGQGALGYAQYLPPDISLYTTQKLKDRMTMTLGGRVSEELHFDSVTSGGSDDFEKVTSMAQKMVLGCGLSPKIGLISYDMDRGNDMTKPFSDKTATIIDEEIHRIVDECYQRCKQLLTEKKDDVEKVAQRLLAKEVITREDMIELLGKRPFPNRNDAFDKYLEGKD